MLYCCLFGERITMKYLIIAAFCISAAYAVRGPTIQDWLAFKSTFGKTYKTEGETLVRSRIFFTNFEKVMKNNELYAQGKVSYKLGINQFSDMTQQEIKLIYTGFRGNTTVRSGSTYLFDVEAKLPDTVDWRKKGLVTPVKNQGQCGSCWAFSTTGSLEGQHKKKTGKLVSLSEQNLVDCSGPEGNNGCEGGLMDQAFKYIKINKGIDSEASYPYTAEDGSCHYKKKYDSATVTGFVDIKHGDEQALKHAVATIGPISVAIDASQPSFSAYSGGILDDPNCSSIQLDHGVLAVGYGTENGKDYWLVKNSWGEQWGLSGYVKMVRNKNNRCGIATQASYPLV